MRNIFCRGGMHVIRSCDSKNQEDSCQLLESKLKEEKDKLSGNACKTVKIPGTEAEIKMCANGCFTWKDHSTTMCCCEGDK